MFCITWATYINICFTYCIANRLGLSSVFFCLFSFAWIISFKLHELYVLSRVYWFAIMWTICLVLRGRFQSCCMDRFLWMSGDIGMRQGMSGLLCLRRPPAPPPSPPLGFGRWPHDVLTLGVQQHPRRGGAVCMRLLTDANTNILKNVRQCI